MLVFALAAGAGTAGADPRLPPTPDLGGLAEELEGGTGSVPDPGGDGAAAEGEGGTTPGGECRGHRCGGAHGGSADFEPHAGTDARGEAERGSERLRRRDPQPLGHLDSSDTAGHTSVEQRIVGGNPETGFQDLTLGPGDERIVREDLAEAMGDRASRRVSLAYFGHLTDFQVSDEESPSRVEFLDATADPPFPPALSGAHRPQEALVAHGADLAIRNMNRFTARSPHPSQGAVGNAFPANARQGKRAGAAALDEVGMDAGLMTGDLADNQQRNETDWVVTLLEGGILDPNSGIADFSRCPGGIGPADPQLADPRNYAGVQDKDDYPALFGGDVNQFYDPDDPGGEWSDWPVYPGLMDRAQDPFPAAGLRTPDGDPVPTYVAFGNHDGLAQGNQSALAPAEETGTGCVKPLVPVSELPDLGTGGSPPDISALGPGEAMIVPPDEQRQYVDKPQFKELHDTGHQDDAHGFSLVDPDEESASDGAAGYYAFDLIPGIRMIGLDTLCEGGIVGPAAFGNIDDPQWQWLRGELEAAQSAGKLIIVFGHHPIRSMLCPVPDESAPACASDDSHGHDTNPGCDRDPRDSSPVHFQDDLAELLHEFPNAIAYIAGHTHQQTLSSFENPGADGSRGPGDFWGIETASLIDWPPQTRLVEFMDNCDGTLSIFATVLDTAAPATAPTPDDPATGADEADVAAMSLGGLGSIARTLSYNDPQAGRPGGGQGSASDRNVELLLDDPRPASSAACAQTAANGGGGGGTDGGGETESTADRDEGGGGELPFTGFLLLALAIVGGSLLAGGRALRHLS